MPYKSKRPCSYTGCQELTNDRYCDKHRKEMDRKYNKERAPLKKKRYGKQWKKIRNRYIIAHPLCERCKSGGKLTSAQEVHHVKPLSKGGTHDEFNLMSLCTSCHSTITAKEGGRWG